MRAYDIIVKKRNRQTLMRSEIEFLVNGYTAGTIPDYQIAAWLMASFLNGLTEDETYHLTYAMRASGKILDLSTIPKPKIDKHSTGGVGDKISLILAPAVAACGIAVPMTSGRGLGFTGGTLDKLESIPGYKVNLTEKEFMRIIQKVGFVMTGQTETIAPADKKLYALRDVTGTVESIPLITASILSKKLAEGADAVVIDVKYGSGAFMKTIDKAKELALSLVHIGRKMGKKVVCILTNMNQPLGRAVGNSIEVEEALACLQGKGEQDLITLTTVLGGYMLLLGGVTRDIEESKGRIKEKLQNGEAAERFRQSIQAQGGDGAVVDDSSRLPHSDKKADICAMADGYVQALNTEHIGTAAAWLGAGRFKKDDVIDFSAGIYVHKKQGDPVHKGETLATLYYNNEKWLEEAKNLIQHAYTIGQTKNDLLPLIKEVIE